MSGLEVVAVISCVAAVVSAYKDGGRIVKSIKEKRAAKKAPAPTESLETSLDRGPLAVEEARDSGIERYGPEFATGDQIAADALRNILIQLQGTLLKHLWVAQEDDNMTEFNILVDASDFGRIQSVTVLNELYMRMAQAAPLRHTSIFASGRTDTLESISSFNLPWEAQEGAPKHTPMQPVFQATLPAQPIQSAVEPGSSPSGEYHDRLSAPKKKWGIFPTSTTQKDSARRFSQISSSRSDTKDSITGIVEDGSNRGDSPLVIGSGQQGPLMKRSSSQAVTTPSSNTQTKINDGPTSGAMWEPLPEFIIDEDNPWESEISTSTRSTNVASRGRLPVSQISQRRVSLSRKSSTQSTLINGDQSAALDINTTQHKILRAQSTPNSAFLADGVPSQQDPKKSKWKLSLTPRRETISGAEYATTKLTPQPLGKPAAKDPCGGFCMGAYKLQMGLEKESLKLKSQSVSMTGQSNYWGCANSRCVFEAPALKIGKRWTLDDKVNTSNGVQFRWTFLSKSHVTILKLRDKSRQYDYQCVFCDRSEHARVIYHSEKSFIEHVSSHRKQHPGTVTSDRVVYVAGQFASKEEDFDVNLTPVDGMPAIADQGVVDRPDSLTGSPAHGETPEDDGIFPWQAIERYPSNNR